MADGALNQEDQELLKKVDAAQEQEMVAGLSGPDRMVVDLPEDDPNLGERVRSYKKESGDIDIDGKKDNTWKRFKGWWKKGAPGGDDPTTPDVDEGDPDYEVTKFMGGMTRQELGMFVFQWGSQMMANADKGFGGAMGAAGEGAMAGHQARTAADQALKSGAAQQQIENKLAQQAADAQTETAAAATTRAEAYKKAGGYSGEKVYVEEYGLAIGKTPEEIWDAWFNASSDSDRRDTLGDDIRALVAKAKQDPTMLPNAGMDTDLNKKYQDFDAADEERWVEIRMERRRAIEAQERQKPALPADDGSSALPPDKGTPALDKPASDYLNEAQTG